MASKRTAGRSPAVVAVPAARTRTPSGSRAAAPLPPPPGPQGGSATRARSPGRARVVHKSPPASAWGGNVLAGGLQALAAAMSEDELLLKVTTGTSKREPGVCRQLGLGWVHHRRSEMTNPGWPDLVVKAPRGRAGVMFRELKKEKENPTAAQQEWLDALTADGMDAGVWRPSDLLSGRIARELAALAGMTVRCGS